MKGILRDKWQETGGEKSDGCQSLAPTNGIALQHNLRQSYQYIVYPEDEKTGSESAAYN